MRSPAGERIGGWRSALGSSAPLIPLVLLVLAAGFAALYGTALKLSRAARDYGYVVDLDLREVEEITRQREASRRAPEASPAPVPDEEQDLPDAADMAADAAATGEPDAATPPGQPAAGTPAASRSASGEPVSRPGFIPSTFDLGGSAEASDSLQVNKPVEFEQRVLGEVAVRIDVGSRIYVSRADLDRILPDGMTAPASADSYVLLSRLRQGGLDLRYDPIRDRFVLRN